MYMYMHMHVVVFYIVYNCYVYVCVHVCYNNNIIQQID